MARPILVFGWKSASLLVAAIFTGPIMPGAVAAGDPADVVLAGAFRVLDLRLPAEDYAFAWTGEAGYLFGGGSDKIRRLDMENQTLVDVPTPLPRAFSGGSAVVWDDRIYLFGLHYNSCDTAGGLRFSASCTPALYDRVLVFDYANQSVANAPGSVQSWVPAAAGPDGIYFFGPEGTSIRRYRPSTGELSLTTTELPRAIPGWDYTAVWTGDSFYVLTDIDPVVPAEHSPELMAYDPLEERAWIPKTGFGFNVFDGSPAAAWSGDRIWIHGGRFEVSKTGFQPIMLLNPEDETLSALDHGAALGDASRFAFWSNEALYLLGWGGGCRGPSTGILEFLPGASLRRTGDPPIPKLGWRSQADGYGPGYWTELDVCESTDLDGIIVHAAIRFPPSDPRGSAGLLDGFQFRENGRLPGRHPVEVFVWDNAGNMAHETLAFVIDESAPHADGDVLVRDRIVYADGSQSRDEAGEILVWTWSWGDNAPDAETSTATHTYARPGRYKIRLAIRDDESTFDSKEWVVVIGNGYLTGPNVGTLLALLVAVVGVVTFRERRSNLRPR